MSDTIEVGRTEYLSVAATAKLVRAALARHFPGYKFEVRSHSYAGGASVYVNWIDGPPESAVDPVVRQFAGGGFDGMIDMAYSYDSWLLPDGSAQIAGSPGTSGSHGVYEPIVTSPPSPDARLVSFAADHVLTQRTLTAEAEAIIDRKFTEKWGAPDWPDYEQDRERNKIRSRWLFPPCEFVWTVGRGYGENCIVEATGLTSRTAAEKVAKAHRKDRHDGVRGYRWTTAHRA